MFGEYYILIHSRMYAIIHTVKRDRAPAVDSRRKRIGRTHEDTGMLPTRSKCYPGANTSDTNLATKIGSEVVYLDKQVFNAS